jgi:hypothetical protein
MKRCSRFIGDHVRPGKQLEGHVRDRAPQRLDELPYLAMTVHRVRPGVIAGLDIVGEEAEHAIRIV